MTAFASALSFLLLVGLVSSYKFFTSYRAAQCGETYTKKGGILLPAGTACQIKVTVPDGALFTFSLVNADYASMNLIDCDKISIADSDGEVQELCPGQVFSGSSRQYTIFVHNLVEPVKAAIDFSQSAFTCGQTVRRERAEYALTFLNDGSSGQKPCFLVIATSEILHVRANSPSNGTPCLSVEVAQGSHVSQMVKSTGKVCINQNPLDVTITCGIAIVRLDAVGSSVNLSTSLNQSPTRITDSIIECSDYK